jgi:hypothetical protein
MSSLMESFEWMSPEFSSVDAGKNTIRIRGVAARGNSLSKNNRSYLVDELRRSARTWVGKKVLVNHDPKRIAGNVTWMEFSDQSNALEYLADINKEPYVTMLREKSTALKGVSVGASYLNNVCPECKKRGVEKRFYSEAEFHKHMNGEHFIKTDPTTEPHGIIGTELSLVLSPQETGLDTTIQVMETVGHGFSELCEMMIKEKGFAVGPSTGTVIVTPSGPAHVKPKEYKVSMIGNTFHIVNGPNIVKSFETRSEAQNHIKKLEAEELGLKERVEQRGSQFCVIHCHGPEAGTVIKCFDSEAEAEAFHSSIMASKGETVRELSQQEVLDARDRLTLHSDPSVRQDFVNLTAVMEANVDRFKGDGLKAQETLEKHDALVRALEDAESKLKETVAANTEKDQQLDFKDKQLLETQVKHGVLVKVLADAELQLRETVASDKGKDQLLEEKTKMLAETAEKLRLAEWMVDKAKPQFKGVNKPLSRADKEYAVDPVTGRM